MTEIKPIGRFYETDASGCLINESSIDNIEAPWNEAVGTSAERSIDHFRERLQSLYLRGSVPRGLAVEGASDIDFVVLLYDEVDFGPLDREWATLASEDLTAIFPFVTDVEFSVAPTGDYLSFDMAKVTLKARSCLMYGDDLAQYLPPVKLDHSLANALDFMLEASLKQVHIRLQDRPASELEPFEQRWIMKRIVRSGMTLVLERAGRYSPDLYPQVQCFSEYYPEHEAAMHRALELAINADLEAPDDDGILTQFAPWLVGELKARGLQ